MDRNVTIRRMKPSDLTFAAECTTAEKWVSEDIHTFKGFYFHDPGGCLLAELSGKPVGICIATSYGESGFIGELIVQVEARGRGIGTALLKYGVNYLLDRGSKTIYLDGVLKAVPLYERNEFRKVARSWRFLGKLTGKQHPQVHAMQPDDLPAIFALDKWAFGADRSFFLRRRLELFPKFCMVMKKGRRIAGYIQGRCGEGWVSAGPWVLDEGITEAGCLLESLACEAGDLSISMGVLDNNAPAMELLQSLGFTIRKDSPWRMALGFSNSLGASLACWAVGSAAKG